MKVQLNFSAPLLIGSKKESSNFIESEDVIKGSVIRAAFAKVILSNCAERDNKNLKDKDNWIFFKDGEGCVNCRYKDICKNFSNITFSYFYPKDTEVIPLSARICKNSNNHGFYDDLIIKEYECKECKGRLEFTTGLRTLGKGSIPYKVEKSVSMKCAINPYTQTSKDGQLYSIETVSGTSLKQGKMELVYEGNIEGITKEQISVFRTLRVGGDTTVGLGKCMLKLLSDNNVEKVDIRQLKNFSNQYKYKWHKELKEDGINYIAICFTADSMLRFDYDGSYKTTDEFKSIWQQSLGIDSSINVDKVYTQIENYRGYDNSICGLDKREKPCSIIKKGTVIVFSSYKPLEELLDIFSDIKSFGDESINGFGKFKIYTGEIEND